MKKQVLAAAAVAAFGLAGCAQKPAETYVPSSGSLALSRDDAFLYAADSDNGIVSVVDTAAHAKVAEVKVGDAPERIAVGPDDTVYVSNRGNRSVSVIRRGEWVEAARLEVGVEPMGLGLSADGRTLYVVNTTTLDSTEHGSLMAFDTGSLKRLWELPVGEEPRGLALLDNDKALITLHRQGDVAQVDLSNRDRPKILKAGTDAYAQANALAISIQKDSNTLSDFGLTGPTTFHPRGTAEIVVAPDGERAYATTRWARESSLTPGTNPNDPDPTPTPVPTPTPSPSPGGGGGLYGSGGPCGTGAVASPGVLTLEADSDTPQVDDLNDGCGGGDDKDFPPSTITSPDSTQPIQGPIAAVVDPTGAWLFVVNRETNNIAVMPTSRRSGTDLPNSFPATSVRQLVRVGAGPNGIALRRDGTKAYVYNAFDHTLSTLVGSGAMRSVNVREEGPRLKLAEDVLSPEAAMGRKLFFSAIDSRMTAANVGASCATCHYDGRDDGHTWGFPDGPRQTPTLAGRLITKTAPFHWSGEFPTLRDFLEVTVRQRMGGGVVDSQMAGQLASFIDVLPTPDNPYKHAQLTEAQQRGSDVFLRAQCQECHAGEALTNNRQADVGTFVLQGSEQDNAAVRRRGLNTPSLLGLARSAPYLHDGSAGTLKERLLKTRYSDQHGKTSQLTDAELDDLVEFLRVL